MIRLRAVPLAAGFVLALAALGVSQEAVPESHNSQQQSASSTTARKLAFEVEIPGASQWTDTGIALLPGDRLAITARGTIHNPTAQAAGPEGLTRSWSDLLRSLPVNGVGSGALIGRIGDNVTAVPFAVGSAKQLTVNAAGHLFLGINQLAAEHCAGSFQVSVMITPAEEQAANPVTRDLALPADFASQIPRRVADASGNLGDLVNFIVVGPEDRMRAAFQGAGWVQVDRTKADAIIHAVLSSTAKQSYVEMPMSELYLFGRVQDFGFARAEPIQVVSSRHHLRLWKAPFDYQGQTVWAGAATHDIGFERDQRTGGTTHKIDPDVDQEREFVRQCFQQSGALSGSIYLAPSNMVREARTATGGVIQSDGRVLVLALRP